MRVNTVKWISMAVWTAAIIGLLLGPSAAGAGTRGISVKARSADGTQRTVRLYSGYHALVIGCGAYHNGWPMLPSPVKDAREVAGVLQGMGWQVDLLENPDWQGLRRSLNELIVGPGKQEDKAVLIWFSGHGHTLGEAGGDELGYIVPVDAPDPARDEVGFMENAISMRQIETVAKRINARHVMMLFDSCFSGAVFQAVRSGPTPHIEEKIRRKVRQFITAGTGEEKVPDDSHFKTVFVQGVRDADADRNKDGYVTGLELGGYIQERVVNYSRGGQHPQFGMINDPKLDKGDFVFALKTPKSAKKTVDDMHLTLPPPVSGESGDYDKIIQDRRLAERKWQQWQSAMEDRFQKYKEYDRSDMLTPLETVEAWGEFLSAYHADNPTTRRDDEIRAVARRSMANPSRIQKIAAIQRESEELKKRFDRMEAVLALRLDHLAKSVSRTVDTNGKMDLERVHTEIERMQRDETEHLALQFVRLKESLAMRTGHLKILASQPFFSDEKKAINRELEEIKREHERLGNIKGLKSRFHRMNAALTIRLNHLKKLISQLKPSDEINVISDQTKKPAETEGERYHIVGKGETLYSISRQTGISLDQLRRMNNLKGNRMKVGQKLRVR